MQIEIFFLSLRFAFATQHAPLLLRLQRRKPSLKGCGFAPLRVRRLVAACFGREKAKKGEGAGAYLADFLEQNAAVSIAMNESAVVEDYAQPSRDLVFCEHVAESERALRGLARSEINEI